MSKDFDLSKFQVQGAAGMDAFFSREPQIITPVGGRKKLGSLQDLQGFVRLSNETLIHKADRDLWTIKKDGNGSFFIERMFDDTGNPLKC
jgi:hypothetical protein